MPEFGLCMTAGHHPKNNNPGLIGVFSTWHKEVVKNYLRSPRLINHAFIKVSKTRSKVKPLLIHLWCG